VALFLLATEVDMDRCAIFLDGGYLQKLLAKEFGKPNVDYGKLANALAEGCDVLRTYFYNCPPYQSDPPTAEEKQLI
jgi:hypothetical protein